MSIVISEKMYVGYNRRGTEDNEVLLAFATYLPLNGSKNQQDAFEKRKATVDSWTKGYWGNENKNPPPDIIENDLQSGFKIAREVRRYGWGGGNVVWRIEDPRGFELEISSANMASIMSCCTLRDGLIEARCKWGWNTIGGSRIVLLPEHSEPYIEAVKTTKVRKQKEISIKDVNVGDRVQLKNQMIGIYCGSLHYIQSSYLEHRSGYGWKPSSRRTHFFLREVDGVVYVVSSPKVVSILERRQQDGAEIINARLRAGALIDSASGNSYVCVSNNVIKSTDFHLRLLESELPTETNYYNPTNAYFVREPRGELSRFKGFLVDNLRGREYARVTRVDESALSQNVYLRKQRTDYLQNGSYCQQWKREDVVDLTKSEIEKCDKLKLVVVFEGNDYPPRIY